MRHSPSSHGDNGSSAMTLQRLQQLLDAYGANTERWPSEERAAASALLAHSAEARAQQDEASRLDALLDLTPSVHPSIELVARILAAAPTERTQTESARKEPVPELRAGWRHLPRATRRSGKSEGSRRTRVWFPLAVAASLAIALWSALTPTPRQELSPDAIASLGVYHTPTDVLLQWPGVEILNTLPSMGCVDSELGCPELTVSPESQPQSQAIERHYV